MRPAARPGTPRTRRHRLRIAPTPASFHLAGVLGYAALTRNPTRVLVRDGAGRPVQDQELGSGEGNGVLSGRAAG